MLPKEVSELAAGFMRVFDSEHPTQIEFRRAYNALVPERAQLAAVRWDARALLIVGKGLIKFLDAKAQFIWTKLREIVTSIQVEPYPALNADLKALIGTYYHPTRDAAEKYLEELRNSVNAASGCTVETKAAFRNILAKTEADVDLFCVKYAADRKRQHHGASTFNVGTVHGVVGSAYNSQVSTTETLQPHSPQSDSTKPDENRNVKKKKQTNGSTGASSGAIFIGHGRSPIWRELKDFLSERLQLDCVQFNSDSAAGLATTERLAEMLEAASFAFLVMTAEDTHADGKTHARENVIHEAGLFQGKLGFRRAIILLEDGCEEFSNIHGLTQIRFPKGNVMACGEEIRRVLEREGILVNDNANSLTKPLPAVKAEHSPDKCDCANKVVELRNALSEFERILLGELSDAYLSTGKGVSARKIHSKFGKEAVREAMKNLGWRVFWEVELNGHTYEPNFLGMLVAPNGEATEQLAIEFVEYLQFLFDKKPEQTTITSREVEERFGLSKEKSTHLYRVIFKAEFLGTTAQFSPSELSWQVGVWEGSDDLYKWESKRDFVCHRAVDKPDWSPFQGERGLRVGQLILRGGRE